MANNPKKRDCPALGKIIKRNDCGENRISRYDCPEHCEFNPFSPDNYSDLLELEAQLDERMAGCAKREPGLAAMIDRMISRAETHPQPDVLIHDTFTRAIYFTPGEDGRTAAQAYMEDGSGKIKNDTRILLQAKREARVALLEVRDVIDTQRIRVLDLLQPDAGLLTICDRSWAKRAVRYDLGISWRYSLPHFDRVAGVVSEWMDFGLEPLEVLLKIASHNGGPSELGEELDQWLLQHMELVNRVMHDAAYQRQRLIYEGLDAMLCRATYTSKADVYELIGRLTMEPDVDDDATVEDEEREDGWIKSWDWFQSAGEGHHVFGKDARVLLGRVLQSADDRWRLETFGQGKYERLKQLFEDCMGGKVEFSSERKDNIAAKTLGDHRPLASADLERVPLELLENLPELDMSQSKIPVDMGSEQSLSLVQMRERQLRDWVDESIPKLGGVTPREAARDPQKRAELLRLVKPMIRSLDQDALKAGEVADIDWIYDALCLDEIRAAAPPLRETQDRQTFQGPSLNQPVLPPIPARELMDMEEVYDLEDRVFELFGSDVPDASKAFITPNSVAALDVLAEVVAGGDDDLLEQTKDLAQVMMPLFLMLLGTSDVFELEITAGELRAETERQVSTLVDLAGRVEGSGDVAPAFTWIESSRQPQILKLMLQRFKEYEEDQPGSFDQDSVVPMEMALCLAAAFINLMCQKLDRVPR